MKTKIILSLLSFFFVPTIWAQDVTVYIQAKVDNNAISLDTIILENLSSHCRAILSQLPSSVTIYKIDLLNGKLIYSTNDKQRLLGIFFEQGTFGIHRIQILLFKDEIYSFTVYSLSGQLLGKAKYYCHTGKNQIEVSIGSVPFGILAVNGESFSDCFKCSGNTTSESEVSFSYSFSNKNVDIPLNVVSSITSSSLFDFIYTPGDKVRFSVIKTGLYPNHRSLIPKNKDSIFIPIVRPCDEQPSVIDYDGNIYHTVRLGNQCWIRENIKSVHYSEGTPLINGSVTANTCNDYSTKYWFDYENDTTLTSIYGRLYTGAAILNSSTFPSKFDTGHYQGICPIGWHIPNEEEWLDLEAFLGMGVERFTPNRWRGTCQGNNLKEADTIHWKFVNDGTDDYGFHALPSGVRNCDGTFSYLGIAVVFWAGTADNIGSNWLFYRMLTNSMSNIYQSSSQANQGYSCRCIRN